MLVQFELTLNTNTMNLVMNIIKCGLDSKDEEVIEWTGKVLSKLGQEFDALEMHSYMWKWFNQDELLDTIFLVIDQHPNLI